MPLFRVHGEDSPQKAVTCTPELEGLGASPANRRLPHGRRLTKQFISKAPYLRGIPQVGLIEEVAYLLRSALQGLQVVAHLLMEIVGAFEG